MFYHLNKYPLIHPVLSLPIIYKTSFGDHSRHLDNNNSLSLVKHLFDNDKKINTFISGNIELTYRSIPSYEIYFNNIH